MNDLFRAIFGTPSNDQNGKRMDDRPPDDHQHNFGGNGGNDDEDNDDLMSMGSRGGIFGFPLFNDPTEIHQHFQQLINEMNKAFGIFGFSHGPSINWEDEGSNMLTVFNEEPPTTKEESLRDSYLKKPDCACNNNNIQKENLNVNLNLKNDFEPGPSNNLNSNIQFSYPKVYSKSIFIQTVKKPDGSVETIKKVYDHTGNEETVITQSNMNDPHPPEIPKDDTSGISIFKKFFSF